MKKEIRFTVGRLLLIVLIMLGFNILSSSAATSYAISASKIGYTDNSSIGADNVQAAIDGTCTKFSNQLTNLSTNIVSKMYPIGSIYITTSISSAKDVASTLGVGTWEAYGVGKTIVGVDTSDSSFNTVGKTGGSKTNSTTLSTANLPRHTHTINHTHTISETKTTTMALTAESAGSHTHDINSFGFTGETGPYYKYGVGWGNYNGRTLTSDAAGAHTHKVTGSVTIPKLTTATQSTTTSGATGSGTSFTTSTIQPYITVYMYKRTA